MVQFSISFDLADSPNYLQLTSTEQQEILTTMNAAATWWSRYLAPVNTTLDLSIVVDNSQFDDPSELALGSADFIDTGTKQDTAEVYEAVTDAKIQNPSAPDPNGSAADLTVWLDTSALQYFYFRPDPTAFGTPSIPSGLYDALSIFLHEIGHGLGIQSFSDSITDASFSQQRSTYDTFIHLDTSGNPAFFGPNAMAATGSPYGVELEPDSISHIREGYYGDDLMTPEIAPGTALGITSLDAGIISDLGVPMRAPTDGDDVIYGYFGGNGSSPVHLGNGNDVGYSTGGYWYGDAGNDTLYGSNVFDDLEGGDGNDQIYLGTQASADHIDGGTGNDFIEAYGVAPGYAGNDIWGGSGYDTISYAPAPQGVIVELSDDNNTGRDGFHGDIEAVIGSSFNDEIVGTPSDNSLDGGPGDDTLNGHGGNDIIEGGSGRDTSIYSANKSASTILHRGNVFTVSGPDGTETLTGIEKLQFSDGTIYLGQGAGARDFDATGTEDLLFQNTNGQTGLWLLNGATRLASGPVGGNLGSSWKEKGAADFDGDGNSDILFQNTSGQIEIWFVDGLAAPGGGLLANNPGTSWHVIGPGDFDGDGFSDILFQNTNGQAAIWFMDGLTRLGGDNVGTNPGTSWHVIGSGDFNGDGKADILWQNNNGQAAIWFMNGATRLPGGGALSVNPGSQWQVKGVGDFNGDGYSDILWQNKSTGQIGIWLMNGTTRLNTATLSFNPGFSWQVKGAEDLDGNGEADIVLQNTNGQPGVWFMSGLTRLSTATIGANPGTSWQIVPQAG